MRTLRELLSDSAGLMAVETALVTPVLLTLGLGAYQVSTVVARQHALQSAVAEAQQIVLAKKPDSQTQLNTIKGILSTTSGVPAADISVTFVYNCGSTATLVANTSACGVETPWTYVRIALSETYSPVWTNFGVGSDLVLSVDRRIQIS